MGMSKEFLAYEKELMGNNENLNHIYPGDPRLEKLKALAEPKKANDKKVETQKKMKKKVKAIHRDIDFFSYEDVDWETIRDARKAKTLSQKQMSDILGIKYLAYSRYESGYTNTPLKTLKNICRKLNIELDLIKGEPNKKLHTMYRDVDVEIIKSKRELWGMNKKQAAEGSNVSVGYYAQLENGGKPWSHEMLSKVCEFLELDIKEVRGVTIE